VLYIGRSPLKATLAQNPGTETGATFEAGLLSSRPLAYLAISCNDFAAAGSVQLPRAHTTLACMSCQKAMIRK